MPPQGIFAGGGINNDRFTDCTLAGLRISEAVRYTGDQVVIPNNYGSDEQTLVYLPLTGLELPATDSGPHSVPLNHPNGGGQLGELQRVHIGGAP